MTAEAIALAMTGASGAAYGLKLLEQLLGTGGSGLSDDVDARAHGGGIGGWSQTA